MTPGALSKLLSKTGDWLLPTSAFILVFSLFLPEIIIAPDSVDGSWQLALHAAWEQHLQFGSQIIFTFGPWGFLYGGYAPATFPVGVMLWTAIALVFWWGWWRVACHLSGSKLVAWLWFIMFASVTGMHFEQGFDLRMMSWAMLLLCLYFFVEDRPLTVRQVLLVLISGLLVLVKFTGFMEMTIVIGCVAIDTVVRHRRFPWILPIFAGSVLFFWVAAGQPLKLLAPFLHHSIMLTGGYTEAMGSNPFGETTRAIYFAVAAMPLIGLLVFAANQQPRSSRWTGVAALASLLFLSFKHGYVRCDQIHEITAALEILLIALACVAVTWPFMKKRGPLACAFTLIILFGIFLFASATFHRCYREQNYPQKRLWVDLIRMLNPQSITAPLELLCRPEPLELAYRQNLNAIRQACPLPLIRGDADVYPWRQAVLLAHGFSYNPRPVIQSYSAYTPELAELNARHLRTAQAPKNILFSLDPQNANYPSLEDGLSWPELLTRYEPAAKTDRFLILERSPNPHPYHLTLLTNLSAGFGKPVDLPEDNQLIWAKLQIHRTAWGSLVSLFYKPPPLAVVVTLRNGGHFDFRLVPGMAQSGFLLSPLVESNDAFALLAGGARTNLAGSDVISITMLAANKSRTTRCYQPTFGLQLYQLDFSDLIKKP